MKASLSLIDMLKKDKEWFEGSTGSSQLQFKLNKTGFGHLFAQHTNSSRPETKHQFTIHNRKPSERKLGKTMREVKAIGSVS
jgi:hypothetical protein